MIVSWIIFAVIALAIALYCIFGKTIGHVPDFRKSFAAALLVVYTIIMLIFCSCGSSKSSTKQDIKTTENVQTNKQGTTSTDQQLKVTETTSTDQTTEETTTEYDTGLPVDSRTGKPPIKRETHKITTKGENKQKESKADTKEHKNIAEQTSNDKTADIQIDTSKQTSETTVPKQVGGMIWAFVALGVVAIVGFVVYRMRGLIRVRNKETPPKFANETQRLSPSVPPFKPSEAQQPSPGAPPKAPKEPINKTKKVTKKRIQKTDENR